MPRRNAPIRSVGSIRRVLAGALRAIPQVAPLAATDCATIFDARNGQNWRTECEGRVSIVKRRHDLSRCCYKELSDLTRWVGLGVIPDNLINIGRVMDESTEP